MAKKQTRINTSSQGVSLPTEITDWIRRRAALKGTRFSTELTELLRTLMAKDIINQVSFEATKNGSWVIKSARTPEILKGGFLDKDDAIRWAEQAGFNRRGFVEKNEEAA